MINTKLFYWQHVNPDANKTMFPSNKLINPNSCYLVEIINNASADEVTKSYISAVKSRDGDFDRLMRRSKHLTDPITNNEIRAYLFYRVCIFD